MNERERYANGVSELKAREGAILLRPVDSSASAEVENVASVAASVPIVSIEGASPSVPERKERQRARRLPGDHGHGEPDKLMDEGAGEDALEEHSRASTTSEVNSNDDAASIASRLSQIVSEQEFQLVRPNGGQPPAPEAEQCKPETSLSVRKRVHSCGQAKLRQVEWQSENRLQEAPADDHDDNEGCDSVFVSVNNRPERGNLRALESSRRSVRVQRSNSLNRNEQPMLNIRRSVWTLDEFEQAFKPTAESKTPSEAGSLGGGLGDESREPAAVGPQPQQPFEWQSAATESRRNLLIKASRNALSLQANQTGAGSLGNLNVLASAAPPSLSPNSKLNGEQQRRTSLNQLEAPNTRRSSRAHSISSSIGSSLDSCRSVRPFKRLGSLLRSPVRRARTDRSASSTNKSHSGGTSRAADELDCWSRLAGCCHSLASLKQYLPILEWLPAYRRQYLWGDLTAGLAVAVLNISTSLSAAVVAQTELGAAFRSSIVNTLVYALLCSSRHTSFGSWSIMSQMLLDSVRRALSDELILNRIALGPQASWTASEYETWHMNIIIMYTFLIGLVQLLAGLLGLGNILASFIPEALCSSMIAATAFTMAIGQLANMCGTSNRILYAIERNSTAELAWAELKNPRRNITDLFAGLFRWMQQLALLFKHYEQINLVCVALSVVCVLLLLLNQTVLQSQLQRAFKRKNLFVPSELILLVGMIVVSYALNLKEAPYNVTTCGPITLGLGLPNVPNLRLLRELWFDSLATALISYTMVFIMAKTYSNKLNYEVDGNQELIACGAGNLIGGLFDALPATASFSRTAGQVEAGGQTQMASLVNCVALFVVAQWLGHHVSLLPVCVMSATLFFGFVRMMARTREALLYWRICKVDFAIWLVTYSAILTLDLVNGFVYGFIFSILTMLYRAQNRRCYLLGSIGTSDVYVPLAKYPIAREFDGIKIFQFCGPIHYVSADLFERLLRQKTRVNVKQILQQRSEPPAAATGGQQKVKTISNGQLFAGIEAANLQLCARPESNLPSHIILDFSMISFIDSAGVHVIKKIIVDYERVGITVMLASLASHVAAVVKNEPSLWDAHRGRFYVTLADAVHHALSDISTSSSMFASMQTRQSKSLSTGNNTHRL